MQKRKKGRGKLIAIPKTTKKRVFVSPPLELLWRDLKRYKEYEKAEEEEEEKEKKTDDNSENH